MTQAENGQVAVQQIQQEIPDLVMLDVLMPMMNGIQVLQRLRDEPTTQGLPVILLTAFSLSESETDILDTPNTYHESETDILDTPNTYHVTKPWHRGVVESAINSALAQTAAGS